MDPLILTGIVKAIIDGLVMLISQHNQDPRQMISSLLDEHPLVQAADKDVQAAIDAKFGGSGQ